MRKSFRRFSGGPKDWDKCRDMVIAKTPEIVKALNEALEKRNWKYQAVVKSPYVGQPDKAFGTIRVWIPHTADNRRLTYDSSETRNEYPTDKEIEAIGEIMTEVLSKVDGIQLYRAKHQTVSDYQAGSKGFIWYKYGPDPIPELNPSSQEKPNVGND